MRSHLTLICGGYSKPSLKTTNPATEATSAQTRQVQQTCELLSNLLENGPVLEQQWKKAEDILLNIPNCIWDVSQQESLPAEHILELARLYWFRYKVKEKEEFLVRAMILCARVGMRDGEHSAHRAVGWYRLGIYLHRWTYQIKNRPPYILGMDPLKIVDMIEVAARQANMRQEHDLSKDLQRVASRLENSLLGKNEDNHPAPTGRGHRQYRNKH